MYGVTRKPVLGLTNTDLSAHFRSADCKASTELRCIQRTKTALIIQNRCAVWSLSFLVVDFHWQVFWLQDSNQNHNVSCLKNTVQLVTNLWYKSKVWTLKREATLAIKMFRFYCQPLRVTSFFLKELRGGKKKQSQKLSPFGNLAAHRSPWSTHPLKVKR